ncbi:hypothetical protein Barb6XT_03206 [Bacteroidales bacterium Barb6XT]|nr:hypothetical protein Barb6XT_03206 [Bacteroidales bacterium Barb6XT]
MTTKEDLIFSFWESSFMKVTVRAERKFCETSITIRMRTD